MLVENLETGKDLQEVRQLAQTELSCLPSKGTRSVINDALTRHDFNLPTGEDT
jgi:hypothetical protein